LDNGLFGFYNYLYDKVLDCRGYFKKEYIILIVLE